MTEREYTITSGKARSGCQLCSGPMRGKGKRFCSPHCYHDSLRRPKVIDAELIDTRFWAHVVRTDACWLWQACVDRHGYGELRLNGPRWLAHRLAYVVSKGPIPRGFKVLHTCDTPPCVRPVHLFLGTQADNMRDVAEKQRARRRPKPRVAGERNGNARLTVPVVQAIRVEHLGRDLPYTASAARYGVTPKTIRDIVHRRTWRQIPEASIR